MKNFIIIFTATVLSICFFIVSAVEASKRGHQSAVGENCKMVETTTLGVSFSNIPIELKTSRTYVESEADKVMELAAGLAIEDIHIQNFNYNVYGNNSSGCGVASVSDYKLNGNLSFQIGDSEKAGLLSEKLGEEGYNVNFNMNAYRQCQ